MSEANNIISLPSESKIWYNTLYLASKIVFEFDIELLYGRYPKSRFFFLYKGYEKDVFRELSLGFEP